GGICLTVSHELCRQPVSSLFFFVLALKNDASRPLPFFLLAKKLGFYHGAESLQYQALRLQFLYELNCANSQSLTLEWTNIEQTGSDNLRTNLKYAVHQAQLEEEAAKKMTEASSEKNNNEQTNEE
ncbi:MAG: hypothetical protein IK079_05675, partial [Desulfovibrio sp.]|nr:hypothetical protein [Desulfovibrio sp.]